MLDIRWSIGLGMKCRTWYQCILATENTLTNRTINRNLGVLLHFAVLMAKRNMYHVHRDQRLLSYLIFILIDPTPHPEAVQAGKRLKHSS